VVDDASTDGTAEVARCFGDLSTEIVSGGRHLGRSGALNAGTRIGTGDVVLFLDSDCAFNTANGLTAHLQALHEGVGVSVSPVRIAGTDFWARYSNEAARRRDSGPSSDTGWLLTTACAAAFRHTLEDLGGFDEAFNRYGFEDRDLLARAIDHGYLVRSTEKAAVRHDGVTSVREVTEKLRISACYSAPVFASKHPTRYLQMRYARVDHDLAPTVWVAALRCMTGCLAVLVRLADWQIQRPWIPYVCMASAVQLASALAYSRGSAERAPHQRAMIRRVTRP